MSLVTFKCNKCARTYRYGREEGVDVRCECLYGKLERYEKMSLEEKIGALIAALEQNTNALLNGSEVATDTPKVQEKPEDDRATTKPDNSVKRKKGRGKAKGGILTVESVKALAKKIALDSDDPKECMNQIREVVSEIAEICYENTNVGIDKFDDTGLILLNEELIKFVYKAPVTTEKDEESADPLEI